ncbi:hypothetical protein QQF64_026078 [Cirrhinus molitorella]|uniref:ribonuclease H n=1 Tax=Cirrhinus molitorella TaxID=172907 RepID=A0ABR3NQU0_9TELE
MCASSARHAPPTDVTAISSPQPADTAAHHRGAGMDLAGPLPKSVCGHEHILVIVDYTTQYPEVPLGKATAKAIAQELFLLASRVGISKEILTDQGTPFMSRLIADMCRLLVVKQLRTSVYHPQTDGLVERFNQTLKQMLRRVAAEDGTGTRCCPTSSLASEKFPRPPPASLLVREHLCKAQQAQQRHYNQAAQLQEFQPGERVMVLVPTAACKFLATWQGPYSVMERVRPVNYRLSQPGRRRESQLHHVNLLKRWVGTRDQLAALANSNPVVVDINSQLVAGQKAEPQHLIGQFSDVFSTRPGQTNVIEHDIKTPPGVVVRQHPYRVPEARWMAIEHEIQDMLKLGVIELPFVLHGTPATFQLLMDILLRPHQTFAATYLDEVVVHSETWEDHLTCLRRVLMELRRAGLTANPRKCHLALLEAKYLGFTVGRGLVRPQPAKVEAVRDAPRPTTKSQVRDFLGLARYYRCFIPNFSSIASP